MKRTNTTPLLYLIGSALLIGTAACLFVYTCFSGDELQFDTLDEHNEDYL